MAEGSRGGGGGRGVLTKVAPTRGGGQGGMATAGGGGLLGTEAGLCSCGGEEVARVVLAAAHAMEAVAQREVAGLSKSYQRCIRARGSKGRFVAIFVIQSLIICMPYYSMPML